VESNRRDSSVDSPAEVVEQYFDAWTSGNAARAQLRDDMSLRGPIDTFDKTDALLASKICD
jgi:hypothetical protein